MGVCAECNTYVPDTKSFCGNCGAVYKADSTAAVYAGSGDEICPVCSKSVSITLRIKAEGCSYHLACFECHKCSRPVYATQADAKQSGGFERKFGEIWCKRCVAADAQLKAEKTIVPLSSSNTKSAGYSGDGVCTECGKQVSPTLRVFGPNDNLYHLACFECSRCVRPVFVSVRDSINPGGYEIRQGKTWCKKCVDYDNKEQSNKKVDIRWDANALGAGKGGVCSQCEQPLAGQGILRPSGLKWCPSCVREEAAAVNVDTKPQVSSGNNNSVARERCSKCGKEIYEGSSKQVGKELYHVSCAPQLDPCGGCKEHVAGRCILAPDGLKWHESCFVCSRCGGSMLQGHGRVSGKLQCVACMNTPAAGVAAQSSPSGTKFCQQCGCKLEGRKFCTSCGTPVAVS